MTMLVKEEEVATSLAPASTTEVISQPVMQQETISIKSAYFVGYFFEHFYFIFFDQHSIDLVAFHCLVVWYVINIPVAINQ